MDESMEIEPSAFITKLLETEDHVTAGELHEWAKEPDTLLSDINIIIKSYRENVHRAVSHKNAYSHNKAILENTKLYNTKLEDNIKRYTAIVDRLITAPATPAIPAVPAVPNPSPKNSEPSPAHSRPGSPTSHAPFGGTRVAKLPDPTLFTGDRTVFDNWLVQIKNKLRGNTNSYPSEDLKIIYVSSRLTGNTLALTNPRIDEDSPNRYRQLSEFYSHLKELYSDPNKIQNARRDFGKLQMHSGQVFQEFYTLFLRLSTEGSISLQDIKYKLNEKLPPKLQESVHTYYNDPSVNATRFAQYYTTNDQQIKAIYEKTKEYKKTGAVPVKFTSGTIPPYTLREYASKEEPKEPISTALVKYVPPYKRKQRPIKTEDLSTVKYYNCNEFGYYIRYCPVLHSKETKVALSRIEPGLVPIPLEYTVLAEHLEDSSSDSGMEPENEYP
jgi:hypothetical protein